MGCPAILSVVGIYLAIEHGHLSLVDLPFFCSVYFPEPCEFTRVVFAGCEMILHGAIVGSCGGSTAN